MKYKLILSAAALSLLLPGIAYSQQEQDKEKQQQEERQKTEENHQQAEKAQQEEKKQQQESEKQSQEVAKQQQHVQKQQEEQAKKQTEVQKNEQRNVQRTEQHEVAHERGRIPDDRFRASFGREHVFRVERREDRRFQYGGFWFSYAQPWPADWAYSDDVYVDFIDGQYYLIDLRHPGVRLLLVVE